MTKHKAVIGPSTYYPHRNLQSFWLRCRCGEDLKAATKPDLLAKWDKHKKGLDSPPK